MKFLTILDPLISLEFTVFHDYFEFYGLLAFHEFLEFLDVLGFFEFFSVIGSFGFMIV